MKGDYWVWDAGKLIHNAMARELGLHMRRDVSFYGEIYVRQGSFRTNQMEWIRTQDHLQMTGALEKFMNDPAFRKFIVDRG
jgi:hypothetical protein